MSAAIAALVRVKDEAGRIGAVLDALAGQKPAGSVEIVVVDSGSRDGTLEVVRGRDIEPISIPAQHFTYGRALNVAAAATQAEVCIAVSAHVGIPDSRWAERMAAPFADSRVACAYGPSTGPDLRPLKRAIDQDLAQASAHPLFGYSNSAGSFRRSLWAERPFDETLAASEDKEWAWHWLRAGMLVRLDPALAVCHSHDDEGPVRIFRRVRGDVAACATFSPVGRLGPADGLREWLSGPHGHRTRLRALADPRRAAMIAGKVAGSRA